MNVLPHLLYLAARTLFFFWLNYVQVVAIMILQDNGNQAILGETILLSQTVIQFVQFQQYSSELVLLFNPRSDLGSHLSSSCHDDIVSPLI